MYVIAYIQYPTSIDFLVVLGARLNPALDGKEAPLAGHAGERVIAAILEPQPRAGDQILDGPRNQHLAPGGARGHLRARLDRDAADAIVSDFAFAGVEADADVGAEPGRGGSDGAGATDGASRAVERADEPVRLHLEAPAAEPLQFLPRVRVEAIHALAERDAAAAVVSRERDRGAHHGGEDVIELE